MRDPLDRIAELDEQIKEACTAALDGWKEALERCAQLGREVDELTEEIDELKNAKCDLELEIEQLKAGKVVND